MTEERARADPRQVEAASRIDHVASASFPTTRAAATFTAGRLARSIGSDDQ